MLVVVLAGAGRLSGEHKWLYSIQNNGVNCSLDILSVVPPGIPVMSYYLVDVLAASSSGEAVDEGAAAVLCGVRGGWV